jgi:putative transposase
MPRKRYKPEEIVAKLRQVDLLALQEVSMAEVIRQIGVRKVAFYRWRQEFGGLKADQVKRLKDLDLENRRLRKTVSDLTLGKLNRQRSPRESFTPRALAPVSSMSEDIRTSPNVTSVLRSMRTFDRANRMLLPT